MRGPKERSSQDGQLDPPVGDAGFFEEVISEASDAVITADSDGTIVYANDAVEDLLGYAPEAIRGEQFCEFVPERLHDRYDAWFDRYTEGDSGTPLDDETDEVTWLTADGGEIRLSVSGFTHENDGRQLFTGFIREAPTPSGSAERLREEEALIDEIFETSPIAFAVRDEDGELLRANDRATELVGVGSDELPFDSGDDREWTVYDTEGNPLSQDEQPVGETLETGEPVYNEEVIVERPDSKRVHLSVSVAPVYDGGDIQSVVSAAEDITELKQTQFELEQQRDELETELSEVFSRVTDAFFALNDDWEFTYVNDEAQEMLLRTEEELLGESIWDEFSEALGTTFQREYERAMDEQEPVSFVEYYPPLSTWFEVRAYPSETGLSVYFRDVTDRIEYERELERYETIVETVDDGIYTVGPDGTLSMVNSAFTEITGYDREELIGTPPSVFYDEDIEETVKKQQREIIEGDRHSATVEHVLETKGGDGVPIETTFVARPTENGHERIGVLRDITERKKREAELEEQNERLDAFASMLAHELRNPLEIAQIYLDMGIESTVDERDDQSEFREVERALDRIEKMIDTLLVVTRQGEGVDDTEPIDLNEVASEWWDELDPDGTLVVETDREIVADSSRLRQLLENLYRNAVEHGSTSGQPSADDAVERGGSGVTVQVGDLPDTSADGTVGFYVEDDGPGIPEDKRGEVFEPGYSTSNVGIGFGLAVVQQLIEAHDWDCEITESESGGARFEFRGVETPE